MNALTRFECMRPADCVLPALITPSSAGQSLLQALPGPVSYTHLTLPTIYSV